MRLDPGGAYSTRQQGANTVVEITGGAQVVLVGVQLSSLDPGWISVG